MADPVSLLELFTGEAAKAVCLKRLGRLRSEDLLRSDRVRLSAATRGLMCCATALGGTFRPSLKLKG